MSWYYLLGPFSLGGGVILAGFRRKDREPRKKVAVLSVAMILIFSLCMFLTPLGAFMVSVGAWMAGTATGGGWTAVVGIAIVCLVLFALGFLLFGVVRDIAKDGTPDRPTYLACMAAWIVAGLALGAAVGPKQAKTTYDDFHKDVVNATAEAGR